MRLSPSEVERFYAIWQPLITFVNQKRHVVPDLPASDGVGGWDPRQVITIRDVLWADDPLRHEFIAQNPAHLSAEDLAMVASWDHRRAGTFTVLRHLKKYSIFISDQDSAVYGVLGLTSSIEEMVPFVPCLVKTVLLPFENQIIYDSLMMPYNISFGPGYRRSFNQIYMDAKERGAIVTSLLPDRPHSLEEDLGNVRSTNAKVLEAFRTDLYQSGLSTRVVERDLAGIATFASDYLTQLPEPRSLREFGSTEVQGYVAHLDGDAGLTESQRRQRRLGLKRFTKFLRDTERMDYRSAQDILDLLK